MDRSSVDSPNQNGSVGIRVQRSNLVWFFFVLSLGLTADLLSKSWVFQNYYSPESEYQQPHWWYSQIFGIQTSTNPGALFGIAPGYHHLFSVISVGFLGFVFVWLFKFGGLHSRWLSMCLGLITGGILGNLYDRLGLGHGFGMPLDLKHHVRDWILFQVKGVPFLDPWPNFNIADSCLVVGAILLFIHGLFLDPNRSTETKLPTDR